MDYFFDPTEYKVGSHKNVQTEKINVFTDTEQ